MTNDDLVWYLTFIIHMNTNSIVMWETLPNNGTVSRIQNLHQVEQCAFLGSHAFVPISWMCKKQTSVSHSSTESDIISLDAGLRLDGNQARKD